MENASKALLIAGTTIIGVLIITIFVYVFREGSKVAKAYDQKQQNNQLELYNSKFEQYNRSNNTIMDLISVCNLAFSINENSKARPLNSGKSYEYDDTNAIEITVILSDKTSKPIVTIPKVYPTETSLNKNQILYNGNAISIYRLASETFKQLSSNEPKIENIQISGYNENNKLSTTHLNNNKTVYKYLFKCENITYKSSNGQIESMQFRVYVNNEENYKKINSKTDLTTEEEEYLWKEEWDNEELNNNID